MFVSIDPVLALSFAPALFLVALISLALAVMDWRDARAHGAYWRERKLIELHAFAEQLRKQVRV